MKWIYNLFGIAVMFSIINSSCSSDVATSSKFTEEEFPLVLDSVLAVKIPALKEELWADFEIRKNIILKFKIDSILGITRQATQVVVPSDTLTDINNDVRESNISN